MSSCRLSLEYDPALGVPAIQGFTGLSPARARDAMGTLHLLSIYGPHDPFLAAQRLLAIASGLLSGLKETANA